MSITVHNRITKLMKYEFSKHIVKLNSLPNIKSLKDLHFNKPNAPCQFAVSEPFKLFTKETVQIIRDELQFNEKIENSCYFSSPQAPLVIRGTYQYSPFLKDLWTCNKLSNYISNIIGENVIPHTLNDELGHINVQIPVIKNNKNINNDNEYIFNWHVDQDSPIVLIVMLSEIPQSPIGGSTLYKDGLGQIHELIFNEIGCAYILQGTQIPHAAAPGVNFNRLTAVCGYKINNNNNNRDTWEMDIDPTCLGNAISFS
eukprot:292170_1